MFVFGDTVAFVDLSDFFSLQGSFQGEAMLLLIEGKDTVHRSRNAVIGFDMGGSRKKALIYSNLLIRTKRNRAVNAVALPNHEESDTHRRRHILRSETDFLVQIILFRIGRPGCATGSRRFGCFFGKNLINFFCTHICSSGFYSGVLVVVCFHFIFLRKQNTNRITHLRHTGNDFVLGIRNGDFRSRSK